MLHINVLHIIVLVVTCAHWHVLLSIGNFWGLLSSDHTANLLNRWHHNARHSLSYLKIICCRSKFFLSRDITRNVNRIIIDPYIHIWLGHLVILEADLNRTSAMLLAQYFDRRSTQGCDSKEISSLPRHKKMLFCYQWWYYQYMWERQNCAISNRLFDERWNALPFHWKLVVFEILSCV